MTPTPDRPAGRPTRPAPGDTRPGPRTPRRRPSRAVIIRRRIVALLILLAVIALLVWGVTAVVGLLTGGDDAPAAEQVTAAETETGPVDPQPCQSRDLEVDLAPTAAAAGKPVTFDVTLRNTSQAACLADAGRETLVLTVSSGEDRVWSSADCPAEPAKRALLIDSGDTVKTTLTWDGSRSAQGCPGGQRAAGGGTYRVTASLDGAMLPGAEATFTL
ncbi:hypothetical protein [Georgenia thermotolerans]|uniref:DUF4232 domain-containing protein n=1 Tax=Georgenia thermotolerans TaxID=527326 RepID=A0A7J5UPL4_9MICO|nr:hypothetical protein [Georgenia thermotolerans]KAE8764346.1 hypothetical protein GB883_09340 [Georgenia thermotolerans]